MEQAFGLEIPLTLDEVCHPRRTALLVYDMQLGIVSQIGNGRQVIERVRGVLQAAREGGYREFCTRHMSLPNEVAGVIQLRTAMAWQHVDYVDMVKPAFLRDSPGFQIAAEIAPLPSESSEQIAARRVKTDIAISRLGYQAGSVDDAVLRAPKSVPILRNTTGWSRP